MMWIRIGTLTLILALATGPLLAQSDPVGTVVLAKNDVRATPSGGAEASLGVGDAILVDMRVVTGTDSAARMTFDPQGAILLGPEANVLFDRHQVDRITGRTESLFSILVGKLRLVLSPRFRGEVEIDTPTSTIGVKGTDLYVEVFPSGLTLVSLFEGEATVTDKRSGRTVTLVPGERRVVTPAPAEELADTPLTVLIDDLPVDRRPQ